MVSLNPIEPLTTMNNSVNVTAPMMQTQQQQQPMPNVQVQHLKQQHAPNVEMQPVPQHHHQSFVAPVQPLMTTPIQTSNPTMVPQPLPEFKQPEYAAPPIDFLSASVMHSDQPQQMLPASHQQLNYPQPQLQSTHLQQHVQQPVLQPSRAIQSFQRESSHLHSTVIKPTFNLVSSLPLSSGRVCTFVPLTGDLLVSTIQASNTSSLQQHGVSKANIRDINQSFFLPIHSKPIRDLKIR